MSRKTSVLARTNTNTNTNTTTNTNATNTNTHTTALALTLICSLASLPAFASATLSAGHVDFANPIAPVIQMTANPAHDPIVYAIVETTTAPTVIVPVYTAPELSGSSISIGGASHYSSGTMTAYTNGLTPSAVPLADSFIYFSAALLPLVARFARRRR